MTSENFWNFLRISSCRFNRIQKYWFLKLSQEPRCWGDPQQNCWIWVQRKVRQAWAEEQVTDQTHQSSHKTINTFVSLIKYNGAFPEQWQRLFPWRKTSDRTQQNLRKTEKTAQMVRMAPRSLIPWNCATGTSSIISIHEGGFLKNLGPRPQALHCCS